MITVRGKTINTTCGRFLVKLSKPDTVTKGGIIIPSTVAKETDYTGVIVAAPKTETGYCVGDMCVVAKHAGKTVETDDTSEKYKIYDRSELLYVWTEKSLEQN